MANTTRIFVLENAGPAILRDNNGNQVTFGSFAEILRYTGVDFTGKYYIGYEPDINFFQDSEDAAVNADMIPYQPYEDLIANVALYASRQADPYYGLNEEERREYNRQVAVMHQEETLFLLQKNAQRKSLGLPPVVLDEDEDKLKEYTKAIQGDIDNPQAVEGYNPPLPPGVTPPSFDSITVEVTRVAGWQGNMGWRAVIKSKSPSFTPANLALSVHTGADCTGYKYTTGAFQFDAEANEYFAICPPGQEPGNAAEHFGLLYGAAQLSCFTLASGQESILVYAYN